MTARDVAARLAEIEVLRNRCLAVATLDAILSPDWVYRAELRDGAGNDCFIVFTSGGAFIKGLDHESPMAPGRTRPPRVWPALVDAVPEVFGEFVTEPAFAGLDGLFNATFCMWREHHDPQWRTGPIDYTGLQGRADPDGAHQMLGVLTDPTP